MKSIFERIGPFTLLIFVFSGLLFFCLYNYWGAINNFPKKSALEQVTGHQIEPFEYSWRKGSCTLKFKIGNGNENISAYISSQTKCGELMAFDETTFGRIDALLDISETSNRPRRAHQLHARNKVIWSYEAASKAEIDDARGDLIGFLSASAFTLLFIAPLLFAIKSASSIKDE